MNNVLRQKFEKMELSVLKGRSGKSKGKPISARLKPMVWKMIYLHMDRYGMTQTEVLEDLIVDGFNFNAGQE